MENNAFLLGSIPNVRYYTNFFHFIIKKDWRYVNEGILDRTHLRFFTEKSLIRTIKQCNFKIINFKKINKLTINNNMRHFIHLTLIFFINLIFFNYFEDIKYMRFGFLIQKK